MAGRRKDAGREDLKRLEDRLAEVARRSPWSAYVMKNFDALTAMIQEYGAHWDTIVAWAIDEGHVDKDKGLSPEAARKAYERERDRRKKADQTRTAQPQTIPHHPSVRINPVSRVKPDPATPGANSKTKADEELDKIRKLMTPPTYGNDK